MSRPIRVLVIDDGEGLAKNVTRMLRPEHEVEAMQPGRAVIGALEGGAGDGYDAIVCSLNMPEIGGDELHAALAISRPEIAARCAFVTSGTLSPLTRKFIGTVAERVILKPFGLSELREIVRRAAGREKE